jgi:KaiC/GvpD/RAD55 family RecA-like ATPase
MSDWFSQVLNTYARVAITGGPLTGKTTLSNRVTDRPVIHTDDFIVLGWSRDSQHVMEFANETPGPLIVEGVAVPRALRKGMNVDAVIWLDKRMGEYQRGQATMAAGVLTVFREWRGNNPRVPIIVPTPKEMREVA